MPAVPELELTAGESQRQLTVEREGRFLSLNLPAGRLRGLETMNKASSAGEKQIAGDRASKPNRMMKQICQYAGFVKIGIVVAVL